MHATLSATSLWPASSITWNQLGITRLKDCCLRTVRRSIRSIKLPPDIPLEIPSNMGSIYKHVLRQPYQNTTVVGNPLSIYKTPISCWESTLDSFPMLCDVQNLFEGGILLEPKNTIKLYIYIHITFNNTKTLKIAQSSIRFKQRPSILRNFF